MKTNFASHPKSKFWSSRNEGKPQDYSHKKFWFDCECSHSFEKIIKDINFGGWCPYCCIPSKKLCSENKNCIICINKSFASVDYSKNLSNKNIVFPFEIFKNSHKKYLFECPKCKHTCEQQVSHITRGSACNYCANHIMCQQSTNCIICFNKSFASIKKSSCWSIKNKKKPIEVFKSSAEKFWFNCDKCGNEFDSRASHITDGSWCPKCRYKTEDKLNKILIKKYPSLKSQYKVDWCKNIKHLPFDIAIEEKKIIIELDGSAHFEQVAKWKTPEHTRNRDLYKMKCANENNFSIIRILQDDVFKDKYDWLTELCDNIEKITIENRVQNIYMCKNNEYKDFDI